MQIERNGFEKATFIAAVESLKLAGLAGVEGSGSLALAAIYKIRKNSAIESASRPPELWNERYFFRMGAYIELASITESPVDHKG